MNYIDLTLGIMLVFAAIQGFRKGFIVEVSSLIALILGVWGAIEFSHLTSQYLAEHFDYQSKHMGVIAFAITFVLIVVVVAIVGKVVDGLVKVVALNFLNRIAGLVFGLIKSAIILSIVIMIFDKIDESAHILPAQEKSESRLYKPMKNTVTALLPFLKFWETEDDHEPSGTEQEKEADTKTT